MRFVSHEQMFIFKQHRNFWWQPGFVPHLTVIKNGLVRLIRRVWVNSADDPANCSFILPAVARRGPVTVSVGTDGSSPALARTLRDRIVERVVTPGVELAAADLAAQRADCHKRGISTESIDWSDRVAEALARYDQRL